MRKLPPNSRNETPENVARVRKFRGEMGASERVLWEALREKQTGFRFRRQHPVGPYSLDFYCAEAMLCVEVDGPQHAEREASDAARDAYLATLGVLTLRIPSADLFAPPYTDLPRWLRKIVDLCEARSGRRWFARPSS